MVNGQLKPLSPVSAHVPFPLARAPQHPLFSIQPTTTALTILIKTLSKSAMKLSLKLREDSPQKAPLIKAKIPITVLTLPFISGVVAGHSSDLAFSLTTNFPSCPSLRLSYTPTSTTSNAPPFSVCLKSGVGAFGSPKDSPLIISVNLNLFNDRNPSFMLQIKPQFGHFSVHKTALSNSSVKSGAESNPVVGIGSDPGLMGWSNIDIDTGSGKGLGFGMEKRVTWRDLKMESLGEKDGILSGFKVRARSELPVGKKMLVNFRWGVNFPAELRKQLPYLTVDKIGIQRIEEVLEVKKVVKKVENGGGEVQKLSGMYSWMRRDLEELRRENRELRRSLEGIKERDEGKNYSGMSNFEEKRNKGKPAATPMAYSGLSDIKSRRSDVEETMAKEMKKGVNGSSLENELQKAILAKATS